MKIYRGVLSKESLLGIEDKERQLFVCLAHIANEIKGYQKLLLWSSDFTGVSEVIAQGRISLSMMLLRTLAGKLNEAHEVIRKNFHSPGVSSHYYNNLSDEGSEALDEVKRYFGKKNLVNAVRKRHAFHYSPDQIDAGLRELPDALEFYLEGTGSANNLFYFAEVLASRSLLLEASSEGEDPAAAFRTVVQEVLRVAHLVDDFVQAFMVHFTERYQGEIFAENARAVELGDLPTFSAIRIDWFTDTSTLREDYADLLNAEPGAQHETSRERRDD